jgi:hypothetical protein
VPRAELFKQVPRAELFKLPPPKAQLVRLPWKVGSLHRVVMPYNIEVTGRYAVGSPVPRTPKRWEDEDY